MVLAYIHYINGVARKNTISKCKRRQKLTAYHCVGLLEKGDPYQTQDHLNHGIRGMLDPNPKCRKHLKSWSSNPTTTYGNIQSQVCVFYGSKHVHETS